MKTEHEKLENTLTELFGYFRCRYIKIPDVSKKMMWLIRKNKRYDLQPRKRPFDAILITEHQTYCIEVKINYDKLKPHQKKERDRINEINPGSFIVFRKVFLKDKQEFRIEYNGKEFLRTTDISKAAKYCIGFYVYNYPV